MLVLTLIISSILAATSVTITEPVDGETYNGDWLTVRAIVENENELPDSVHYSLNGELVVLIPRLDTDWYTYMANDCRTGYSESPAPHDNTVLWTAPVTGTDHEFVSPVIVDGRVYHASEEQEIAFCLDAATGAEIWRFENIGDPIDDALHVVDGKAYIASDSIYCLSALTGAEIWSFGDTSNYFSGPPVPYQGYVFASSAWFIHCLDDLSGEEIWRSDSVHTSSSMTVWNDILFVPGNIVDNPALYAFEVETGDLVWQNHFTGFHDSSPVLYDNTLYIGSMDGYMLAYDPSNGSHIVLASYESNIESTPATDGEYLYFGVGWSSVFSINRLTGDECWSFETPGSYLHASPGVADGLVFWGGQGQPEDSLALIHAVDTTTGEEVWNYEISCGPYGIISSPSIVDGVMYIGATDGNLYAFGTGLKYTYLDNLYAQVGSNELIVTSFDDGAVAADTISFTVTGTGINLDPSRIFNIVATPNPFVSTASISFELSETGFTSVQIFDLSGRLVTSLVDSEILQGNHSVQWNGNNNNDEEVSAGLYLCRIESAGVVETTGLCLLN